MSKEELLASLEEKMTKELNEGNSYEALQYVQSFIARKKKSLAPEIISSLVFRGGQLLVDFNSSSYAGTLLIWFFEGGAGEENRFNIELGPIEGDKYCDVQRLHDLLAANSAEKAAPIVEVLYKSLTQLIDNASYSPSDPGISARIKSCEEICGDLLESSSNWKLAYTSRLRSRNLAKAAKVLDSWSHEAYPSEKPLFFVRAVLYLYSTGDCAAGKALVHHANDYVVEQKSSRIMAAWHLAQIISELEDLPITGRTVNKAQIYEIVRNRYSDIIGKLDEKLPPLLVKIGMQVFGCRPPQQSGIDPFAMLQALSGGGKKGPGGGLDMSNIMSMLGGMSGKK